jgi:mutator protein MutT
MSIPGQDYIGVGVGAIIINEEGYVFLAQRGQSARNEQGCWEFPGGTVEFGEGIREAIIREFQEEYGMEIKVHKLLGVFDHILAEEKQHWLSVTFIGKHVGGTPYIMEPDKCNDIGWFPVNQLPRPLSLITRDNLVVYLSLDY